MYVCISKGGENIAVCSKKQLFSLQQVFCMRRWGLKSTDFSTNLPIFLYVQDKHVSPHLPKKMADLKA